EEGTVRSEEQVFYQLLREGGASTKAAAFEIAFRSDLNGLPIESVMLIEAAVFGSDDGVLEVGRDLAERDEFVPFVIRRVVNPGLPAALHVHSGGRGVDPTSGHKNQRSERPKKRHGDDQPSNYGAKKAFAGRRLRVYVGVFSHL